MIKNTIRHLEEKVNRLTKKKSAYNEKARIRQNRYLDNNPKARKSKQYSNRKSVAKRFIREDSTIEDFNEFVLPWVKERQEAEKRGESLDV